MSLVLRLANGGDRERDSIARRRHGGRTHGREPIPVGELKCAPRGGWCRRLLRGERRGGEQQDHRKTVWGHANRMVRRYASATSRRWSMIIPTGYARMGRQRC